MGGLFRALSILAAFSVLTVTSAHAGMEGKAVQLAARAIGFLRPHASPGSRIAVIGNAAGLADVQMSMPSYAVANSAGADAFAAFVSSVDEARALGPKVLTIGPLACVEAGVCIMAVETTPKVNIYLSMAAATAAGYDFDANFKLMVTMK